jgi:small subunit ribosomal protein S4e
VVDIATNKILKFAKYDAGAMVMITGGRNAGRVGVITRREKHKGSFEIVHVKDASGHEFATRATNVFVIGTGNAALVSLHKSRGLRMSIVEELEKRQEKN